MTQICLSYRCLFFVFFVVVFFFVLPCLALFLKEETDTTENLRVMRSQEGFKQDFHLCKKKEGVGEVGYGFLSETSGWELGLIVSLIYMYIRDNTTEYILHGCFRGTLQTLVTMLPVVLGLLMLISKGGGLSKQTIYIKKICSFWKGELHN